jgi:hypothetical protein
MDKIGNRLSRTFNSVRGRLAEKKCSYNVDRNRRRLGKILAKKRWSATEALAATMAAFAVLTWLENLLRGPNHILVFKDIVVDNLCFWCYVSALSFIALAGYVSYPLILILAAAGVSRSIVYFRRGSASKYRYLRVAFRILFTPVYYFAGISFSFWWWLLCDSRPGVCALVGAALLAFLARADRFALLGLIRRHLWILGSLAALASFTAFQAWHNHQAREVVAQRLLRQSAFDAVVADDGAIIAATEEGTSQRDSRGVWRKLNTIAVAKRPTYDASTGSVYLPNNEAVRGRELTVVRNSEEQTYGLTDCTYPIEACVIPEMGKLAVLCEYGSLHLLRLPDCREEYVWHLLPLAYSLDVDRKRGQIFVSQYLSGGFLTEVDLATKKTVQSKFLGATNTGIKIDPITGDLWIARPMAGELIVLDPSLKIIDRVPVGFVPRDIEIGKAWVAVTSYTSGTITVVDRIERRVRDTLCVRGHCSELFTARGRRIAKETEDSIFVSNRFGLWRVNLGEPHAQQNVGEY